MSYIMHFNKNHDKLGRFTFGDGNGDGVIGKADPNSYRTPELDKKYAALEKTGVVKDLYNSNLKWLGVDDDTNTAASKWGKDIADSVKLGVEAMRSLPNFDFIDPGDIEEKDIWSTFLLSDWSSQNAYPEVAYLASKGFTKDQIVKAFHDADEMHTKNTEFFNSYTGYPKDGYERYSDKAYDIQPYKGIYTMADRAYEIGNDKPGFLGEFANKCVELAKDMKHSDSSNSLTHFNPNHDPKTGQFTFAIGGAAKAAYNGKRYGKYAKDMAGEYMKEGYGRLKSRTMGYSAAKANEYQTKQYNLNLKRNQKAAQKYEEAKLSGNEKKTKKYAEELYKTYKNAKVAEELINKPYEIGKDWYNREMAQIWGGIPMQILLSNRPGGIKELYKNAKTSVLNKIMDDQSAMKKASEKMEYLDNEAKKEGFDSWDDVPENHWLKRD